MADYSEVAALVMDFLQTLQIFLKYQTISSQDVIDIHKVNKVKQLFHIHCALLNCKLYESLFWKFFDIPTVDKELGSQCLIWGTRMVR